MTIPTKEKLKELFKYKDGQLYWKNNPRQRAIEGPAGRVNTKGYRQVRIDGKYYMEHRVIAVMHNKDVSVGVVDHKNRNRSDNKNSNLRVVSHSVNNKNRKMPSR